jgi:hypothetical protein
LYFSLRLVGKIRLMSSPVKRNVNLAEVGVPLNFASLRNLQSLRLNLLAAAAAAAVAG